jgi:predicted Zn-dependent protease
MLGERQLRILIERVLEHSKANATQVLINAWESGLTRFASSFIHQNVAEQNMQITVKCVNRKRIGEATTNNAGRIENTVDQAQAISRISKPIPGFRGFPKPKPITPVETFIPATYEATPLKRAEICCAIINKSGSLKAYGGLSTSGLETCIANSNGLFVYNRSTSAIVNATIMGESGSGKAGAGTRDIGNIHYGRVAEKAIKKAKLAQKPVKIKTGKYEVILEELAVAELLQYLGYVGFNALRYQEGRSPFCGKIGKEVMGANMTIWDDGLDESGCPFPFDFQGVPKQNVALVEDGVLRSLVYDHNTARKENRESTGHSIDDPVTGPIPLNLFMKGGASSIEDMVSSTKRGILVTRFWYTNLIDPMTMTVTGMTRDGTFLVQDGEIKQAVRNLRFTQSILEAFSRVKEFSKPVFVPSGGNYGVPYLCGAKVPALKIEDWDFTGISER